MRLKSLQGINNGVLDDHHHNVAAEQYHNPFICSCCLYLQVSADVAVVWKYLLYNDRYEWGPKPQEYENDFVCDVNTNKNRIIYFYRNDGNNTFSSYKTILQWSTEDPIWCFTLSYNYTQQFLLSLRHVVSPTHQ